MTVKVRGRCLWVEGELPGGAQENILYFILDGDSPMNVSVIYCCVANRPHIQLCKTTIYYLWEFLWDRNLDRTQQEQYILWYLGPQLENLKAGSWKVPFTYIFGGWCWCWLGPQLGLWAWIPTLASPCDCLASLQHGRWVEREREGERASDGSCIAFSNLTSKVTLCPFHHILCIGIKLLRPQNCQTCFNTPQVWTIAKTHWLNL